jgi:RNA polymerase sigma-70 factor (ECF subfamily)
MLVIRTSLESMASSDQRSARFEALFERHYARVHRYVLRRADAHVADEVASETFTVAWRRLDDIPSHELAWLLGVARRTLGNMQRAERRRAALTSRLAFSARAAPPTPAGEHSVLRALARLAEKDREALLLVAWEGLSPAEAARALGSSVPAFHLRTFRARRRLRQALAHEDRPHQNESDGVLPVEEAR